MSTLFDCIIEYDDKRFQCDAQLKSSDCKLSPFTEEYKEVLREFEEECGRIKSVTIVFKK